MQTTWVLVANRTAAKAFASTKPLKDDLQLVHDLPHPEGRLHGKELEAAKAAEVTDKFGTPNTADASDAPAHDERDFAKHIAQVLEKGRNDHAYQKLVLVAEPKFLGQVSGALDKQTSALVERTVPKDLSRTDAKSLQQHLS